jgi:hypothetical protein
MKKAKRNHETWELGWAQLSLSVVGWDKEFSTGWRSLLVGAAFIASIRRSKRYPKKFWRTCPFPPYSNLFNLASLKHGCKASLFLFSKMGIKATPQILGLF